MQGAAADGPRLYCNGNQLVSDVEGTRAYDGKTLRWEWKYEGELGIYPKDWARRFPHLAERGRWVITEIK